MGMYFSVHWDVGVKVREVGVKVENITPGTFLSLLNLVFLGRPTVSDYSSENNQLKF